MWLPPNVIETVRVKVRKSPDRQGSIEMLRNVNLRAQETGQQKAVRKLMPLLNTPSM